MKHHPQESLSYRLALRLFDSAFAACERLPDAEQQSLIREIGARLLERMPESTLAADAPQPAKIAGISVKVDERAQLAVPAQIRAPD